MLLVCAGSAAAPQAPPPAQSGAAIALAGIVVVAILAVACGSGGAACCCCCRLTDPQSRVRAACVHRKLPFSAPAAALLRWMATKQLHTTMHAAAGYPLSLLLALAALGCAFATSWAWFSQQARLAAAGGAVRVRD